MKPITITKVVSSNLFFDIYSKIQNLLGADLNKYEAMIQKGVKQCWDEANKQKLKFKWYRHEVSQLTSGAFVIILYGDVE